MLFGNSELATYTALKFSDYANQNQDFEKAKIYAEVALNGCTNVFNAKIIEQKVKKYDWILKYKDTLITNL